MKHLLSLAIFTSVALASNPFTYNNATHAFTCTQTKGLAAYCAGIDIIIRCSDGKGEAGNCNDNLADEPPVGNDGYAGCYQSSPTAGDAACTKGGLVYPDSGSGASNASAPFPIPAKNGTHHSHGATGTGSSGPCSTGGGIWSNTTTTVVTVTANPTSTTNSSPTLAPSQPAQQYSNGASSFASGLTVCWAVAAVTLLALS